MPLTDKAIKYYFGHTLPTYLQDFDANGNLIYEGYSAPNTPQTALGFVIIQHQYQQQDESGTNIFLDIHDGTLAGISWTLRTVYTYP